MDAESEAPRKKLPHKTDVFPSVKLDPSKIEKLPKKTNFRDLPFIKYAFIIFLDHFVVYYKFLLWNQKLECHFLEQVKSIRESDHYKEKDWLAIIKRLTKNVNDDNKKNTDVRTCFKWNLNYFLVKSAFTFGLRTVAPGTAHVYQIGRVEVQFYFIDPLYKHKKCKKQEKIFPFPEDRRYYAKRTLHPNTAYCVREKVSYLIYCTNKSYFSVHVIDTSTGKQLPFQTIDPLKQAPKRKTDTLYQKPVKTPRIEEVMDDDDDEEPSTFSFNLNRFRYHHDGSGASSSSDTRYGFPETVSKPPSEDEGPCSSSGQPLEDNVLISFENGEKLTDDDDHLMPPPPPPPPATARTTVFINLPAQKTVKVVTPERVEWFQKQFKFCEYTDPHQTTVTPNLSNVNVQEEPLNLTCHRPVETEIVTLSPEPNAAPEESETNAASETLNCAQESETNAAPEEPETNAASETLLPEPVEMNAAPETLNQPEPVEMNTAPETLNQPETLVHHPLNRETTAEETMAATNLISAPGFEFLDMLDEDDEHEQDFQQLSQHFNY